MRLESIAINNFPPFAPQKCDLGGSMDGDRPSDVHIFVGENGTGKTRLLSLLMAACGNSKELDSRDTGSARAMVVAQTSPTGRDLWCSPAMGVTPYGQSPDAVLERFVASGDPQGQTQKDWDLSRVARGTVAMAFRSAATITDQKLTPMAPVNWGDLKEMLLFEHRTDGVMISQALANLKIRAGIVTASGSGRREDRTIRVAEQLEKTIAAITGRECVFLPEQAGADLHLKVVWGGVRMRLHQLPDGLRAIIGLLASCVLRLESLLPDADSPLDKPVILFIDEPETHLHPAWQRQIVPALQLLLPKAQMFIATHSPFVVSSVNAGWVYRLTGNANALVQIDGPTSCSKGDTYIDAVEDALGLKEWYDPETEKLLADFRRLRDTAMTTSRPSDKQEMVEIADKIRQRSDSLAMMMGREMMQFEARQKQATR